MTFPVLAAFILWISLTGWEDIPLTILGAVLSLAAGRFCAVELSWKDVFLFSIDIAKSLFQAYGEAFSLIFSGGLKRGYITERISGASPWKVFTRVFLVTLTPKTIAVHVDRLDEMLIHRIEEYSR